MCVLGFFFVFFYVLLIDHLIIHLDYTVDQDQELGYYLVVLFLGVPAAQGHN